MIHLYCDPSLLYLLGVACTTAGGSYDLLPDKDQVLWKLQTILSHHWLQVVVLHQVVKHLHRGLLVLQWREDLVQVTVSWHGLRRHKQKTDGDILSVRPSVSGLSTDQRLVLGGTPKAVTKNCDPNQNSFINNKVAISC